MSGAPPDGEHYNTLHAGEWSSRYDVQDEGSWVHLNIPGDTAGLRNESHESPQTALELESWPPVSLQVDEHGFHESAYQISAPPSLDLSADHAAADFMLFGTISPHSDIFPNQQFRTQNPESWYPHQIQSTEPDLEQNFQLYFPKESPLRDETSYLQIQGTTPRLGHDLYSEFGEELSFHDYDSYDRSRGSNPDIGPSVQSTSQVVSPIDGETWFSHIQGTAPDLRVYAPSPSREGNLLDEEPLFRQFRDIVPTTRVRITSSLGDASSPSSYLPSSESGRLPDILTCPHTGCNATFTGNYRKSNRSRHERLNHRASGLYPCQDEHCSKVFRRPDARLKHYRRHHTHVADESKNTQRPRRGRGVSTQAEEETSNDEKQSEMIFSIELDSSSHSDLLPAGGMSGNMGMPLYTTSDPRSAPRDSLHFHQDATSPPPQNLITSSTCDDDCNVAQDSRLTCSICDSTFQRETDLRRHMQKHEGPLHTCEVPGCERKFYRMDKLRDHVRQAHKGNVITIEDGSLQFDVPEEAEGTEQPSSYLCQECGEQFKTLGQRTSHYNRKHVRRFKCFVCDKAFNLKTDLKRHHASAHEPDLKQAIPCLNEGCSQTFARRDNLARHLKRCKQPTDTSTVKEAA